MIRTETCQKHNILTNNNIYAFALQFYISDSNVQYSTSPWGVPLVTVLFLRDLADTALVEVKVEDQAHACRPKERAVLRTSSLVR